MRQQLAAVWGDEDPTGEARRWFRGVSVLMILELFSFRGGCPPVYFSPPLKLCCCISFSAFFPPSPLNVSLSLSLLLSLKINHKYPERRLLVAESCGALAPYLPVRTYCSHRMKNRIISLQMTGNKMQKSLFSSSILLAVSAEGDPELLGLVHVAADAGWG